MTDSPHWGMLGTPGHGVTLYYLWWHRMLNGSDIGSEKHEALGWISLPLSLETEMQPVACGCYKGITLCDLHSDNIQIASPVTGHMSMRTLWVSWETVGSRVPDGRTGFYRNRRGSFCCVLNLAMCCSTHGLSVAAAGCPGYMFQYLCTVRLVC